MYDKLSTKLFSSFPCSGIFLFILIFPYFHISLQFDVSDRFPRELPAGRYGDPGLLRCEAQARLEDGCDDPGGSLALRRPLLPPGYPLLQAPPLGCRPFAKKENFGLYFRSPSASAISVILFPFNPVRFY